MTTEPELDINAVNRLTRKLSLTDAQKTKLCEEWAVRFYTYEREEPEEGCRHFTEMEYGQILDVISEGSYESHGLGIDSEFEGYDTNEIANKIDVFRNYLMYFINALEDEEKC